MEETLNNIVRRIILPKYPWIKDFKWYYNFSMDSQIYYWTLKLIRSEDWKVSKEQDNIERREVFKDVKSLFRMLGLPKSEEFFTVIVQ